MFGFTRKTVEAPVSNETRQVEAVQLWVVKWESRFGPYSHSVKTEFEAFPSKEDAEAFATSLRNAFRLIRYTSANEVTVTKSR